MGTFLADMRLAPTFTIFLLLGMPFAAQAEWPNDCEPWESEYTRQNRACPGCAKMFPKDERVQCEGWSFEIDGFYEQLQFESNVFTSLVELQVARTRQGFHIDGDGQKQAKSFEDVLSASLINYELKSIGSYDAVYFRLKKSEGWVDTFYVMATADVGPFGVLATCTYTNSDALLAEGTCDRLLEQVFSTLRTP